MKNVEVILFCYKRLVFGKILYTKPELIESLDKYYAIDGDYYHIQSNISPGLEHAWGENYLWIWGDNKEDDNLVIVLKCGSEKNALKVFKGFHKCIEEFNKTYNHPWESL